LISSAAVGMSHSARVAEQFANGDLRIGHPDRAQVTASWSVKLDPAVGHQSQHHGGGDDLGERAGHEPLAGPERLRLVKVGPAERQAPRLDPGTGAISGARGGRNGHGEAGRGKLGERLPCQRHRLGRHWAHGHGGRRRHPVVGDVLT
jgi:hypothetical protein